MSNSALAEERGSKLAQALGLALTFVRFIFATRLGLIILVWAVIAFVIRPAMIDALLGGQGALQGMLRARFDNLGLARTSAAIEWVSFAGVIAIAARPMPACSRNRAHASPSRAFTPG